MIVGAGFSWPATKAGKTAKAAIERIPFRKLITPGAPLSRGEQQTIVLGELGNELDSYAAGGARGEVLRRTTTQTIAVVAETSRRCIAGTIAMFMALGAIAAPAEEQMGQTCESKVLEFSSTQQCNWAATTTATRSSARK